MERIETKTIAAFRCGIGNFIEATPAFQALASMDPSGQIDIAIDQVWKETDSRIVPIMDIVKRLPFIQDVVFLPAFSGLKDYKTWFWAKWLGTNSLIEMVFKKKFNYGEFQWDQNTTHESDHYMEIIRKFYGYTGDKPHQMVVPADEPILDLPGKKIVLCNGGFGHYIVEKKWEHFQKLASDLKMFYGNDVSIIKVGWNRELEEVTTFDADYVGKLSVTESFKVIQQADLFITTDTCNMHAADAMGVPMIVIWCVWKNLGNRTISSNNA